MIMNCEYKKQAGILMVRLIIIEIRNVVSIGIGGINVAKSPKQKQKLLYIAQYLMERTDEEIGRASCRERV